MKLTVFKTPKPRRFVHKPIYWNPEEEERKDREERVRKEQGLPSEDGEFKTSIKRGSFRKGVVGDSPVRDDSYQAEKKRSNIRLIVIIAGLLILAVMMYLSSSEYLMM